MKCLHCEISWIDPNNYYNDPNCPFCKALLPSTNSLEGTMLLIIDKYSLEIFNDTDKFKQVITQLFSHDEDMSRLLQIIISNGGACDIYNLKDSQNLHHEYDILIDSISKKTFIARNILEPALDFLFLGIKKTELEVILKSSSLEDFIIEDGILKSYIGFGGEVVIPNSVSSIGYYDVAYEMQKYLFSGCSTLTQVVIPHSVTIIGHSAFLNCVNLTRVSLPDTVTSIGLGGFSGCKNLTEFELPNSVVNIKAGAFRGCKKLSPDTINKIRAINPNAL